MPLNDTRSAGADDELGRGTLAAVEWTGDDREDNWLISYADLLSVIFTMVVLLFGRMTVVAEQPAAQPAAEPAAEVAAAAPDAAPVAPVVAERETAPEPIVPALDQSAVAPNLEASSVAPPQDPAASDTALPLDLGASDAARPPELAQDESLPLPDGPSREDRVADLIEQRFRGQIAATRREHGLEITIPEVALFASARAVLQDSAQPVLTELAATLREGGETRISVAGHTDNVPVQGGQFPSNWDLASARANAVARYLLEQGFEPSRLQSVSYADTRPVASNDSEAGRAANRRVELQINFVDAN
jgi:chemotaxis protein MotB